jgi:hypothetical protein
MRSISPYQLMWQCLYYFIPWPFTLWDDMPKSSSFLDFIFGIWISCAANFSKGRYNVECMEVFWNSPKFAKFVIIWTPSANKFSLLVKWNNLSTWGSWSFYDFWIEQSIIHLICWLLIHGMSWWSAQWSESRVQIPALSPPLLPENFVFFKDIK